jgi:hypothetical protein
VASRHEPFPPLRSIPQESATISNSPPPIPAKNKPARASASVTFSISPPLIVRVVDQEVDPVKVSVEKGVQEADEVKDGVDVVRHEVDVVEIDVVVLDLEVDVVENDVDVLDREVGVAKDRIDVDFEETYFERVGVKFEGIEFNKIDVDKDEFRVTDDTLEGEEVA